MTRFVVDTSAVLHLAGTEVEVSDEHELLHRRFFVRKRCRCYTRPYSGGSSRPVSRERLARIQRMPIRLLGDAVLRRRAWEVADQLGWASTYDAEYVALTLLQADAFVTLDAELARAVEGTVTTASIDALVST